MKVIDQGNSLRVNTNLPRSVSRNADGGVSASTAGKAASSQPEELQPCGKCLRSVQRGPLQQLPPTRSTLHSPNNDKETVIVTADNGLDLPTAVNDGLGTAESEGDPVR
jgi:hypothetical protein